MRTRRTAILAMGAVLAALVALDAALLLSPRQLERWTRAGLAAVFRTPVEIGEVAFSFRQGLRVRGFVVRGPSGEETIAVDEARISIDWRRLRLGEIQVEWPSIDVRRDAEGRVSLLECLNPALLEGESSVEPPTCAIHVAHARLRFQDARSRAPDQVLHVDDLSLDLRLDRDDLALRGAIEDRLWKHASVRGELDRRSGALALDASVEKVRLDYADPLDKPRIPPNFWGIWELLRLHGTGDAAVRVEKRRGERPEVRAEIHVLSGGINCSRFPYPTRDCTGTLRIENELIDGVTAIHVTLKDVVGGRDGGTFGCDGDVWGMPADMDDIVDVRIWGEDVPIDAQLGEALPDGPRQVYQRFSPVGRGSCKVHVFGHTKPRDQPDDIHVELDARAREVTARFREFPVPAELSGEVSLRSWQFVIDELTGKAGGGDVVVRGVASPREVDVRVLATGVHVDEKLEDALLPEHRDIVRMLDLRGLVNADIAVTGREDERGGPGSMEPTFAARITAEPGLTARFDGFPYPLVYRAGEVVVSPAGATIDRVEAAGQAGPLALTVTGTVRAEDVAGGGVEVRIDARRLPVDPQLRAAAAPRARAIYEGVGPEAGELSSLTITALVAQKGAPIELSVDAALAGVAIRPPRAPLPLTGLTGVVHLTPTALALDGVAGELVGAPLRAAGEIALVPGAGTSTATLTVRGLELDDRLARELPPGLAKVFARVRPQGRLDLETRLLGAGMALEPAVSGRLEGGAFLLDFFPLAATTLTAEIRADAREVRIERLRGKIGEGRLEGEGRIELASGPAAEAGEGLAGARFSARVADLPLDARLVDAFPERLRKTLEDLGLGGRATLDLRGAFDPAARPGGLLSYAAEVGLARAKLDVGLALTDIEGTIDAHGSWPLEARPAPDIEGGFRVRHALWKEQDLERFSGRFASGPELFEVKEIRGELLGGVVEGEFYAFGESPRMYGAELSLAGGQLERARVHYGQRKAAGLVEGRLTLAGSPAEGGVEASLKGEGALRVKDGRLYELPTFAGIFSVLSGELPAKPVFDDARVDLALDGKRLLVERAEFSSPVLSLFGTGTIVDGQADLRVVPEIGRPWFNRIPIFGTLWGTLKGNLFLELEVKGSLDDPAVVARPVKMLYEPALWFFQRRRAAEGKGAREEQ